MTASTVSVNPYLFPGMGRANQRPNTCPRAAGRLPSNFMAPKWIPLESNPDVLNAYATKLGADLSEHSFSDVYGLDEVHSHFRPGLACCTLHGQRH